MEKILGEKPPPPPINPMALRDNALEAPLLAQGFNVQSSDLHEIYFKLGNREEAWQVGTLTNRPFLNELQEAGKHGDVFATFRREFESIVDDWWVEDEGAPSSSSCRSPRSTGSSSPPSECVGEVGPGEGEPS